MANPRVSVDEMRAKRQAATVSATAEQSKAGKATATTVEQSTAGESGDGQSPAPATPTVIANPSPLPSVDDILSRLTPDQLAMIRARAAAEGLATGSGSSMGKGGMKLPDGSMDVTVRLTPDIVEQLELWAESDGLDLVGEAQRRIGEALTNFLYGDWNPVVEVGTAAAAAVTAVAAVTERGRRQ